MSNRVIRLFTISKWYCLPSTSRVRHFASITTETRSRDAASDDAVADNSRNIEQFLPSPKFLHNNLRNRHMKKTFNDILAEVQVYLESFGYDVIPPLSDDNWSALFGLPNSDERSSYLLQLRNDALERNTVTTEAETVEAGLISERNQRKYDAGEMVYAPGYHELLNIRGQEFRQHIDRMYGSRLISQQRCDENLPKFYVDCRFMKDFSINVQSTLSNEIQNLHDSNWTSRNPFNISLVNFLADEQLVDMTKRHFLFHYGPSTHEGPYYPHPFAPLISSRSIRSVAGESIRPDEILYISQRVKKYLPDKAPSNVKAVVMCASRDYQPWSSSLTAATADGLNCYRIPVERYVKFADGEQRTLRLPQGLEILRAYFRGEDIGEAMRNAYSNRKKPAFVVKAEERKRIESYKDALSAMISMRSETTKVPPRKERRYERQPYAEMDVQKEEFAIRGEKRARTHKYSREQRREMRERQAASGEGKEEKLSGRVF